jgi:hypothetical protein
MLQHFRAIHAPLRPDSAWLPCRDEGDDIASVDLATSGERSLAVAAEAGGVVLSDDPLKLVLRLSVIAQAIAAAAKGG